jgi:hypothetical protein
MSEWDELAQPSALPDIARDVPLGFCWYCQRRIDVREEAWRPLPHDLMAHTDCQTLFLASPSLVMSRRDYEEQDDLDGYFEEQEELVHDLHPGRRHHYTTEPRLQARLEARVEELYQRAVHALLSPDNPHRLTGEDDQAYLKRIVDDEGEDDDEEEGRA